MHRMQFEKEEVGYCGKLSGVRESVLLAKGARDKNSHCMQNDVKTVRCCWTSFCLKKQLYSTTISLFD